jgi:hypothetical protein
MRPFNPEPRGKINYFKFPSPPSSSYDRKGFRPMSSQRMITACDFCESHGEPAAMYESHCKRNPMTGDIICPILRSKT